MHGAALIVIGQLQSVTQKVSQDINDKCHLVHVSLMGASSEAQQIPKIM
jgi:hypothetical protein